MPYDLDPKSALGNDDATGELDTDGLTNAEEYARGSNLVKADTDGDGLPDDWEVQYGLSPLSGSGNDSAKGDADTAGRTNTQEYIGPRS